MTDPRSTGPFPATADIRAETAKIVNGTHPVEVLIAIFCFPFTILGWFLGRAWILGASIVVMFWVAGKWGYWNGAKIPAEQRVKKPQPQQPRQ